jgi:Zn-dependent protease with chaperone function
VVDNGAEKLSTGLLTIIDESKHAQKPNKEQQKNNNAFRALFIADPDRASADSAELHATHQVNKKDLLRETLLKEPTKADKFIEIFSTHPNITKRLRALQEIS